MDTIKAAKHDHQRSPTPTQQAPQGQTYGRRVSEPVSESIPPLHRYLGNSYVHAMATKKQRLGLQTKLKVNEPGDSYEREADRVADQVLTTPAHHEISGAPPRIQRFSGQVHGQVDAAPASVDQALASPGKPLEPALRQEMEQRFGYDFSRVRVHTGAAAEQSARDVHARAYTMGQNIVFNAGRFAPETHQGRRLIAHELVHVIQQTASSHQSSGLSGNPMNPSATGMRHPPSQILQRDTDTETADPWDKLSPTDRAKAEELYEDCMNWIRILGVAQQAHHSTRRGMWLNTLSDMSATISEAEDSDDLRIAERAFTRFTNSIGYTVAKFGQEWASVEKRYLEEHRWLLSTNVKSTDAIEAAKYLDGLYQQTKAWLDHGAHFYLTDEEYLELKNALDKQEYIRIGALRGARIRGKQLKQMMRTVADLRRKGEDADKFIPEWSERVLEEAAYLDTFASIAKTEGREYGAELADLRRELLKEQQETLKVEAPKKSVLEKGADFVAGAVEGFVGIFVEAAKEAVDLVQINLHFVTFGKYEPKFISDMAAAAEQGATTSDLLKGMVTGIVETPSRFLKACRDGDWEAIGRESVNLYLLAKTIREAPETIKKSAEAVKRLPELVARTQESLRILRQRTVALGLKTEGRLSPQPVSQPPAQTPPAPKPAPTLTVKQGGSQDIGTPPTGMLRDVDAPSRSVQVPASHPVFKNKLPANDPPPGKTSQQQAVELGSTRTGGPVSPVKIVKGTGTPQDPSRLRMATSGGPPSSGRTPPTPGSVRPSGTTAAPPARGAHPNVIPRRELPARRAAADIEQTQVDVEPLGQQDVRGSVTTSGGSPSQVPNVAQGEISKAEFTRPPTQRPAPPPPARQSAVAGERPALAGKFEHEKLPRPKAYEGRGALEFGVEAIEWGAGEQGANNLINTIKNNAREAKQYLKRLRDRGITSDIAEAWAEFYEKETVRAPTNKTAKARAALMRLIAERL